MSAEPVASLSYVIHWIQSKALPAAALSSMLPRVPAVQPQCSLRSGSHKVTAILSAGNSPSRSQGRQALLCAIQIPTVPTEGNFQSNLSEKISASFTQFQNTAWLPSSKAPGSAITPSAAGLPLPPQPKWTGKEELEALRAIRKQETTELGNHASYTSSCVACCPEALKVPVAYARS